MSSAAARMPGLIWICRHLTISITAPEGTVEQDLLTIDVGPDVTIADLKAVIKSDTNVPPQSQVIYYNGRELRDERKTLAENQVKQDDMLELLVRKAQPAAGANVRPGQEQAGASSQSPRRQGVRSPSSGPDPEMVRLQALGDT